MTVQERNAKRTYRKAQRQRARGLAIIAASIMIVLLAAFVWPMLKPASTEALEQVQIVTVTVAKGESIWAIADRYDNNQMDLRKYIDIICGFNNIKNGVLQPGQRINIPIYASK